MSLKIEALQAAVSSPSVRTSIATSTPRTPAPLTPSSLASPNSIHNKGQLANEITCLKISLVEKDAELLDTQQQLVTSEASRAQLGEEVKRRDTTILELTEQLTALQNALSAKDAEVVRLREQALSGRPHRPHLQKVQQQVSQLRKEQQEAQRVKDDAFRELKVSTLDAAMSYAPVVPDKSSSAAAAAPAAAVTEDGAAAK